MVDETVMTADEVAARAMTELAAELVALVLEERAALDEILNQLLVGKETATDRQVAAYFADLALSLGWVVDAAKELERVAEQTSTPVG